MSNKAPMKSIGKAKKSPVITAASLEYQAAKRPDHIPTRYVSLSDLPPHVLNRRWTQSDLEEELKTLTRLQVPEYKMRVPLPSEEWNFQSCPDEEKEMCLKYELSREVGLWRQMAYNYRLKIAGENEDESRISYLTIMTQFPCIDLAPYFPEWPEIPWLSLDRQVRKESLEPRFWPSLRANFGFSSGTPPKYPTVGKIYGKDILYAPFEIDLTETNHTIKRDFSEWLDHFRKVTGIKAKERRGARSVMDVLKSLGATRLLRLMNWEDAANLFLKHGLDKYQGESAWDKAKDRTTEDIRKFSQNFRADIYSLIEDDKAVR